MESHIFRKAASRSREMEVSFPPAHGPREQNVAEGKEKYRPEKRSWSPKSTFI